MRLCCQEQHLPGATLEEKFARAVEYGFDGIELRGAGDLAFAARLPELKRARANGVVMPTVCVDMLHFIGAFDEDLREDAIAQMTSQLTVMAEIGGTGAMTPASYGMFSRRLPPFEPPQERGRRPGDPAGRPRPARRACPIRGGEDLPGTAEPLRGPHGQPARRGDLVDRGDRARLGADRRPTPTTRTSRKPTPPRRLRAAAPYLGHVQVSDSNRLEPGAGHLDWPLFAATLRDVGYSGDIALESRLSGPADEVLPRVPGLLRRYL